MIRRRDQERQAGQERRADDHYSLLATIEDGFDLPRLANARTANTMFSLFPDSDD